MPQDWEREEQRNGAGPLHSGDTSFWGWGQAGTGLGLGEATPPEKRTASVPRLGSRAGQVAFHSGTWLHIKGKKPCEVQIPRKCSSSHKSEGWLPAPELKRSPDAGLLHQGPLSARLGDIGSPGLSGGHRSL